MSLRDFGWVAVLSLSCACVCCARQNEAPVAGVPPTVSSGVATDRLELEAGSERAAPAQLEVTQAEGLSAQRVRTIFAPAVEPVKRCLPGRSGKVTLRVTSESGALHVAVEPGASLDPTALACALDAIQTVYLEETATNAGGPGVPPSGFTSILTVRW